ncbi:MAG: hypothetical protein AAGA30_12670 [Planctomycetota bacterium]
MRSVIKINVCDNNLLSDEDVQQIEGMILSELFTWQSHIMRVECTITRNHLAPYFGREAIIQIILLDGQRVQENFNSSTCCIAVASAVARAKNQLQQTRSTRSNATYPVASICEYMA